MLKLGRDKHIPWLPIAAAVAAVLSAALAALGLTGPAVAVIAAGLAVPSAAKVLRDELKKRGTTHGHVSDVTALLRVSVLRRPPRVSEVDPFNAGVADVKAPVVRSSLSPRPYVPREADDKVEAALRTAVMTIIVGEAASGKSRVGIEALRRVHPRHHFLAPQNASAVKSVAAALSVQDNLRPSVIWLDDLENYLGSDGLTSGVLRDIQRLYPPVTVVATIRSAEWEVLIAESDLPRPVREVLRRGRPVFISAYLSDKELADYTRLYGRDDLDVVSSVERYGLGPYFVGAPDLIDRLEAGEAARNPGAALVHVAADWRRIGMLRPIPESVLKWLYPSYAPEDKSAIGRFDEALTWALKRFEVHVSLLEPVHDPEADAQLFSIPDFIVESIDARSFDVPRETWSAAIDEASGGEAIRIGWKALSRLGRGGADTALRAATVAHDAGIDEGTVLMGFVELSRDDEASAEQIWRKAADGGNVPAAAALGGFLHSRGEISEAETYLQFAVDSGDENGTRALGALEAERGNYDAAKALLHPLEDVGDPGAGFYLALIDYERGHLMDAKRRARAAADAGHPAGPGLLGAVLDQLGASREAEEWYERGADAGDPEAQVALASLLQTRDKAAARKWLRRAWEAEHPEAAHLLGDLLADEGKARLAANYWRQAADRGSTTASLHLGDYLADHGKPEEAESLLRKAARRGNIDAAIRLAALADDIGKPKESEKWLRSAAKRGSATAACNLGGLLLKQGNEHEAKEWLQRSLDAGHLHAASTLGSYLFFEGRYAEAEPLLTRSAAAGDGRSAALLGLLLERTGCSRDAERWYRLAVKEGNDFAKGRLGEWLVRHAPLIRVPFRPSSKEREGRRLLLEAADGGDVTAMVALGSLEARGSRFHDARRWWLEAARQGEPVAAYNLGNHLIARGRSDEGEHWLRQAAELDFPPAKRRLINLLDAEGRSRSADRYRGGAGTVRTERWRQDHPKPAYPVSFRPSKRRPQR